MAQELFRKAALDKLASPERPDMLLQVTSPRDWIGLWLTVAVLGSALVWSVFGSVPTRVDGPGILLRGGGLREIRAAGQGVLSRLTIHVNDQVDVNQVVGEIAGRSVDESLKAARARYDQAVREAETTRAEDEATIAGLKATIAGHQADVTRARAELDKAREDLVAKQRALQKGLIVASRVQAVERDIVAQQATITGLQATIQNEQANIRAVEQRIRAQAAGVDSARMDLEQVTAAASENSQVTSTIRGRVVEIKVSVGDRVQVDDVLAVVEPPSAVLEPVAFVDASVGKRIKPGMEAQISPSTVRREEYGFMKATVRTVGDYPVTPDAALAIVANPALVQQLLGGGAKLELRASLVPDSGTPSGYRWSSSNGPPFKVDSGTPVMISVVVDRRPPISYVLPILRGSLTTR